MIRAALFEVGIIRICKWLKKEREHRPRRFAVDGWGC
jgi:hypothetical protein